MQQLPPITNKQQQILTLLYKYRFLNRHQIQSLLNHKDKRRVISWLKDLREKDYIDWRYDPKDFIAKSQPAIYFLALNGIRYLRSTAQYPTSELRLRYKEAKRTRLYIDRCIFIVDCTLTLLAKSDDHIAYEPLLPADYRLVEEYIRELNPQLVIYKRSAEDLTSYCLEYFERVIPRYQLRKRLKDYVLTLSAQDNPPIALLVCDTTADLLYIRRRLRYLIDDNSDESDITIRIALRDQVAANGVTGRIWEDAL